ncbi:MAG TPA: hypothetical protein DHU78_07260 [Opitutae bacterium]|nr:hypothetical protein [Opitutae bacterium]HCY58634.1 hypothetical protein [Opitutae bacterium]|tara:strand:- start:2063 stop:2797 length:735 start_codon:yes stop_codon:yes gene_type:complete
MVRKLRAFNEFESLIQVGDFIELCKEESMHLARVLRVKEQQFVEILNGKGVLVEGKCVQVFYQQVKIEVTAVESFSRVQPDICLGVAWTKGRKWEEMIRPLTELGVFRITPLFTQRTEARGPSEKFAGKRRKWCKLAIEACKQSGNPWIPNIDLPSNLSDFVCDHSSSGELWIGSLDANKEKLQPSSSASRVSLLIGPEGGWSIEEEKFVCEEGGKPFSLGPYALRVESAALSALAVARSAHLV